MLLTSIWINSSGEANAASLPPPILENIRSLQKNHPHIPHKLFGTTELLSFLEEKFSREVLSAFLALKPYAYKADLARYCVLHEYGGVYADLSYYFVRPLPMDSRRVVVFRDFMWSSPWDASNGVFFAPPSTRHWRSLFKWSVPMCAAATMATRRCALLGRRFSARRWRLCANLKISSRVWRAWSAKKWLRGLLETLSYLPMKSLIA